MHLATVSACTAPGPPQESLVHYGTRTSLPAQPSSNSDNTGPIVHRPMGLPVTAGCNRAWTRTQCLRPLRHSGGPACIMLSNSCSMTVCSCCILAGTEKCFRTRRSRASQTCSMGDMSGEYAGNVRTGTFSSSRNCVQILVHCHAET